MSKGFQYFIAIVSAIVGLFYMPDIYNYVCKATSDMADFPIFPFKMLIALAIPLIPLLLVYSGELDRFCFELKELANDFRKKR